MDKMEIRPLEVLSALHAGGHNSIMISPPGAGKTMLAKQLPTILRHFTNHFVHLALKGRHR